MSDRIRLTIPRRRPFYRVAHLVVGGLAVRLNLTFEHLEDLQLALAGLLDHPGEGGEVHVDVSVDDGVIRTSIGPFDGEQLRSELDRVGGEGLTLGRLLDTVTDGIGLDERQAGHWIELTKRVDVVRSS